MAIVDERRKPKPNPKPKPGGTNPGTYPQGSGPGNMTAPDNLNTYTQPAPPPPAPPGSGAPGEPSASQVETYESGGGMDFSTASGIVSAALQIVGLNPNQMGTMPDGTTNTLVGFFWNMIVTQNITDSTTLDDMVQATLPDTEQFQTAFPGYQEAINNGYIKTPADYVTQSEADTATMINWGIPADLINPTTVGKVIAGGVSTTELNDRLQNGFAAVENAPAEVQAAFEQFFGAQGPAALATLFLAPSNEPGGETYTTLMKMLGGAQIAGAATAANLNLSQGTAQRLADMGQTYASAEQHFQNITKQAGLYEATAGEANKAVVPGTGNFNAPLSASTQGVEAEFGMSAEAQQQIEQEALSRANEFRGGGGAASTEAEGYQGLNEARPY